MRATLRAFAFGIFFVLIMPLLAPLAGAADFPADPLFGDAANPFENYRSSRVFEAWSLAHDCGGVIVAVIDSGVDADHPDLRDNIAVNPGEVEGNGLDDDGNGYVDDARGFNFAGDDADVTDRTGHGTAVAGIVGAVGDNDAGFSGICWSVGILPVKVVEEGTSGKISRALEAVEYAVANGARVLNLSWTFKNAEEGEPLRLALERAGEEGVFVVAAAGNEGLDLGERPVYPASFDLPNLVGVAASDASGGLLATSNHGAAAPILAPGESILTTALDGAYAHYTGTSFAAAHVAGAAALLLARDPSLSPPELRALLVGASPRLDVYAALASLGGAAGAPSGPDAPSSGGCSLLP